MWSLNIPPWKLFRWFRRLKVIDNRWVAASSQQCSCSCITTHAEFFGKTSNPPGDSAPLQPRPGTLQLLAFPKIKTTFERKEISDCQWDSGKYDRVADGNWENCIRSQDAYFEGNWGVVVLCTMLLVSSSVNVSIFHIAWLDIFWTDHIYITRRAEIQAHTERCRHMWQGAAQPERNRAGTLQMMMSKLSGKQTRKTDSFIHHCPFTCQVSQAS